MANKTSIEWTKKTWNPLAGCTAKSSGCLNCYAATMSARLEKMGQAKYTGVTITRGGRKVFNGLITYDENALLAPLSIKKPDVFFVNSMSDLFWGDDEDLATARRLGIVDPKPVPFEFIDKVLAVTALTPQHTYQVLTKRMERMNAYFWSIDKSGATASGRIKDMLYRWPRMNPTLRLPKGTDVTNAYENFRIPLPNVWLGVSVEDQKTADERIPLLLDTPAAIRWISAEPLLGKVSIENFLYNRYLHGGPYHEFNNLDWVVVGGESGPHSRPFDIAWARKIIQQCIAAKVPIFVKQLGAKVVGRDCEHDRKGEPCSYIDKKGGDPDEWPEDLRIRQFPK